MPRRYNRTPRPPSLLWRPAAPLVLTAIGGPGRARYPDRHTWADVDPRTCACRPRTHARALLWPRERSGPAAAPGALPGAARPSRVTRDRLPPSQTMTAFAALLPGAAPLGSTGDRSWSADQRPRRSAWSSGTSGGGRATSPGPSGRASRGTGRTRTRGPGCSRSGRRPRTCCSRSPTRCWRDGIRGARCGDTSSPIRSAWPWRSPSWSRSRSSAWTAIGGRCWGSGSRSSSAPRRRSSSAACGAG